MKKLTVTILLSTISVIYGGGYFAQENVIPESGNVGIGTLNPTTKLDVHGRVKIDSSLYVNDSITIIGNAKMGGELEVEGMSKFSGPIKFNNINTLNNLNNSSFLFLNQGNSVRKIEFPDLARAFSKSLYGSDCLVIGDDANNNTLYQAPIWKSTSIPNSQTGYLYTGVGCPANVGIRTATPRVALDVIGTTYTSKIAVNIDPTILGSELFHLKSTYSITSPQYGNSPIFIIENTDRKLFQINNNGIVRAREVVLDLNTEWPDYVFNSDYSLVNYDDLRTYIASNGHLPNVPSAAEIKENGIEVGAMNVVMMEKIEELTLYILELESRIKSLENKEESSSN